MREELTKCNHTELYQLCRKAGHHVRRGMSRDLLIKYLLDEEKEEPVGNIFDTYRRAITLVVLDHWKILQSQLNCPLRGLISLDGQVYMDICFGCTDQQVVYCVIDNREHEHLIQEKIDELEREDT